MDRHDAGGVLVMPKEWEDGFQVTVRFKSNTHPETWFIEHLNSFLKEDGGSIIEWEDEEIKISELF
tara:strand:- start:409 stop:606 length:198 start_codon:yes stop_codon:yes gene_type:complete